jgi:hypothetical protein
MRCPEYQRRNERAREVGVEITVLLDSMLLIAALMAMAIHFGFWR